MMMHKNKNLLLKEEDYVYVTDKNGNQTEEKLKFKNIKRNIIHCLYLSIRFI